MKLISRKEAIQNNLTKYFTGKSCKHGHTDYRYVCDHQCAECCRVKSRIAGNKDPEKRKQACKQWRLDSSEKYVEYYMRKNNSPEWKEYLKKHREENQEHYRAKGRLYGNKNRGKRNAREMLRNYRKYASSHHHSPDILERIDEIYKEATNKKLVGGVDYHVDHIIPLIHPLVCGLHVPWNLQILTATENLRKSNKFEVI